MTISKVLAASMMTAFFASPILLIGCGDDEEAGKSWAGTCEAIGAACDQTAEEIVQCKSAETDAEAVGCGDQFTAVSACMANNYETPTAEQCGDPLLLLKPCEAAFGAYTACQLAACLADPSKPECAG